MMYTFRNRFRLGDYHRLVDAEVPEVKLADSADDGLVTVYPFQRKPDDPQGGVVFAVRLIEKGGLVSQTNELILQGDGYSNSMLRRLPGGGGVNS
jgi:hypothetical protein